MANALEQLLADLHLATTQELLQRIKSGEASSAELNVARQMLKDNDITIGMLDQESPLQGLANEISAKDLWDETDEAHFTH